MKDKKTLKERKEEKKRLFYSRIISLFIALLLVFSVFGIMFRNTSAGGSNIEYEGYTLSYRKADVPYYEIVKSPDKIDIKGAKLYYVPEKVNLSDEINKLSSNLANVNYAYITLNPSSLKSGEEPSESLRTQEFARESLKQFSSRIGIYVFKGITHNSSLIKQPLIDCNNASDKVMVLNYEEGNSSIEKNGENCYTIKSETPYGFIRKTEMIKLGLLP
ncbi:MAG: hypothetical protein ACQER9_03700 [Nanobdellota archaeon]